MTLSSSNPSGPANPLGTAETRADSAHAFSLPVHDRVVDIANRSQNRSEFLQSFAAELQYSFGAAIVAIGSSQWPQPMMLVVDELLSTKLKRDAIRELLRTAPETPCSCAVPTTNNAGVSTTAYLTRIAEAPDVASVLVIQPALTSHAPANKVGQLQHLAQYARSAAIVARQLPADETSKESMLLNDATEGASARGFSNPNAATLQARQNPERACDSKQGTDASVDATDSFPVSRQGLRLFHLSLDVAETADRIANETRRLVNCDRVTLLTGSPRRLRVAAVSGVAVVDRRSNSIRSAERLAHAVAVLGQYAVLPSDAPLPPQLETPLDEYLDATDVTSVMVLPLYQPNTEDSGQPPLTLVEQSEAGEKPIGVMLLESFQSEPISKLTPAIESIGTEASLALRNALEFRGIFGLRLWKFLGRICDGLGRPWLLGIAITSLVAVLIGCFVEIDHQVIATGNLQPSVQRDVFAAVDGTVQTVHVSDGQLVKQGDLLLTLENAELDQQAEKLAGEILTAQKRLSSLRAVRLGGQLDQVRSSQMAMEQRQLESELSNLVAQQHVVLQLQAALKIVSPIDGTVIAWQVRRRLANRPVATGNLLVSVADHDSPWILDLAIPDQDARDVLVALDSSPVLTTSFASATAPEQTFVASVRDIGTASRLNERGVYVIDAVANVSMSGDQAFQAADHRVGADITAKINCGPRSIVASWFGDVADFFHRHVSFYF